MSSSGDLVPARHFVPSASLSDPDAPVDDPRSSADLDRSGDAADPLLEDFLAGLSGPNAFAPLSRAPTTPQVPGSDGPAGIAAIATLSGQRALAGDRVVPRHSPDPRSPRPTSVLSAPFSESSSPPAPPPAHRFDAARRPASPSPSDLSSVVDADIDIDIPSPDEPSSDDALSDFERLLHVAELSEDDDLESPPAAPVVASSESASASAAFSGPPEPEPEPEPVPAASPSASPPAPPVVPPPLAPDASAAEASDGDADADPSSPSPPDPFSPFHPSSGPVVEFDPQSLVADADLPDVAPDLSDSDAGLDAYFGELADDDLSVDPGSASDADSGAGALSFAGPVPEPVYDAPPPAISVDLAADPPEVVPPPDSAPDAPADAGSLEPPASALPGASPPAGGSDAASSTVSPSPPAGEDAPSAPDLHASDRVCDVSGAQAAGARPVVVSDSDVSGAGPVARPDLAPHDPPADAHAGDPSDASRPASPARGPDDPRADSPDAPVSPHPDVSPADASGPVPSAVSSAPVSAESSGVPESASPAPPEPSAASAPAASAPPSADSPAPDAAPADGASSAATSRSSSFVVDPLVLVDDLPDLPVLAPVPDDTAFPPDLLPLDASRLDDGLGRWLALALDRASAPTEESSLALLRALCSLLEVWVSVDVVSGYCPRHDHWADALCALLDADFQRRLWLCEDFDALDPALRSQRRGAAAPSLEAPQRIRAAAEMLLRLGAVLRDRRTEERLHRELRELRSDPVIRFSRSFVAHRAPSLERGIAALAALPGLVLRFPTPSRPLPWTSGDIASRLRERASFLFLVFARELAVENARVARVRRATGPLVDAAPSRAVVDVVSDSARLADFHAAAAGLACDSYTLVRDGVLRLRFRASGLPDEEVDLEVSRLLERCSALASVWRLPSVQPVLLVLSPTDEGLPALPPPLRAVDLTDLRASWVDVLLDLLGCAGLLDAASDSGTPLAAP